MKKNILFAVLLVLFSLNLYAQNGYIYVHKKAISEVSSVNFSFNLKLDTVTTIQSFSLNDTPDALNAFDLGNSHGAGEGQLWAVINDTSKDGTTHVTNGSLYTRPVNSTQWTAQSTVSNVRSVDGIDANTAVFCDDAGTVYKYDATTGIATDIGKPATVIDVASGGTTGIIVAVGSNGNLYKYSGAGTVWTVYSGSNLTNVWRVDVNPTNQQIVFIRTNSQSVYRLDTIFPAGTNPLTIIAAPSGTSSAGDGLRDVAVSNNGTIYSNFNNSASSANIFEYTTVWTDNATSRSFSGITAGVGTQSWAINKVNPDQIDHTIFTSTILSTNTAPGLWLDDERVQTSVSNGNSIMIPLPAGTYIIQENVNSLWSNSEIKIYDPTGDSSSQVSKLRSTIKVAAGEVVNVVYSNSLLNSVATPSFCGTNHLLTFGKDKVQPYGPAIKGFTSYHYRGSKGVSDGYYALVKNKNEWYNNDPALLNHTPTNPNLPVSVSNPPDPNGYYAIFNASYATDDFFRQTVTNLSIGTSYQLAFWVADLSPTNPIRPNVTMGVNNAEGVLVSSINTGNITAKTWSRYTFDFVATSSTVQIFLKNNSIGGLGNDIAIDDVTFAPSPPPLPKSTIAGGVIFLCSDPATTYQFSNVQPGGTWSTNTPTLITIDSAGKVKTVTGAVGTASVIYTYFNSVSGCTSTTTFMIQVGPCGCYNNPASGTGSDTKHGITLLQRAGADNGNWPMIRKSAYTVLESNTKGFVITRMTTAQIAAIAFPQEGMMVFDTDEKCLKINSDGTATGWSCFNTRGCP